MSATSVTLLTHALRRGLRWAAAAIALGIAGGLIGAAAFHLDALIRRTFA